MKRRKRPTVRRQKTKPAAELPTSDIREQHAIHDQNLRALAQRVENLGGEVSSLSTDVAVMIERGEGRDRSISALAHDLADIESGIEAIQKKQNIQLSDEELRVLRIIMQGKDRSDWLKARSKYYFLGTITTATLIWAGRDWIRAAMVWLRILPS